MVYRIWGDTHHPQEEFWRTSVIFDTMFIFHFINPDLGVIFEKEEATELKGVDFERGRWGICCALGLRLKKTPSMTCILFHCLFIDKEIKLSKALLSGFSGFFD